MEYLIICNISRAIDEKRHKKVALQLIIDENNEGYS